MSVIDACAKASDTSRAEYWMKQMRKQGIEPNVITYTTMINAYARFGHMTQAEKWLNEMNSYFIPTHMFLRFFHNKKILKWLFVYGLLNTGLE